MSLPFPARLDETAWASYRRLLTKKAARDHVVTVQHAKAQNTIGLGSLGFGFKIQTIFQIIPYFLFFKPSRQVLQKTLDCIWTEGLEI